MTDLEKLFDDYQNAEADENRLKEALRSELDNRKNALDNIYSLLDKGDLSAVYSMLKNGQTQTPVQKHTLMSRTGTYAQGVWQLRDSGVVRPNTLKENIEARVIDYNTNQSLGLFDNWFDSCTGVAYQKKSTKFKIIPECEQLINIDKNFNDYFLPINFSDLKDGKLLDSSKGKYNSLLGEAEVSNHPGWLAAVEEDKHLLKEYAEIVFSKLKEKYSTDKGMGFYVRKETDQDQLRALFVGNLIIDSLAYGINDLNNCGSFLRSSPN